MGSPVWPFLKNTNDGGYLNNPNWTSSPADTHRHHPCGYWPGSVAPSTSVTFYTLSSCGRDYLGRTVIGSNNNIFFPIDDTSHFYDISLGNNNGLFIKYNKTLWGTGVNNGGSLGVGDLLPRTILTQVGGDADWESVSAAGSLHSLAIKEDGSLWAAGSNSYGQVAGVSPTYKFGQIGIEHDWKFVYGTLYSSYAIKENGDLYSWGFGVNGNLGHDNYVDYHFPKKVDLLGDRFDSITGGHYAAIGLKNGHIYSCGNNIYGQLCLDNTTSTRIFVMGSSGWKNISCFDKHALLVKDDGTLWGVGNNYSGQLASAGGSIKTQIGTDTDWAKVSTGDDFSMALKTNGDLYSTGGNIYGQLGLGPIGNSIAVFTKINETWGTVICGAYHTYAGKASYSWE